MCIRDRTYTQAGDYLLPNLTIPEEEQKPIGIWGQRHARHLKQHHKILYYNLLTSGKLNAHLAEIDRQAEEMYFRLVKQMAEREGVTEQLKAENQMEWVGKMNNILNTALEAVSYTHLDVYKIQVKELARNGGNIQGLVPDKIIGDIMAKMY